MYKLLVDIGHYGIVETIICSDRATARKYKRQFYERPMQLFRYNGYSWIQIKKGDL